MTISEWLKARTAEWHDLADAVERLGDVLPLTVQVSASDDKAEADAIKRGQRPQQIDAIKQALGR